MANIDTKVASLLLETGILDKFQYSSVQDHQNRSGGRFHLLVIELGFVPEQRACAALAKVAKLPMVSLAKMQTDPKAIALLSGAFCQKHQVYPAALRDGGSSLWLAMADPTDTDLVRLASQEAGVKVRPLVGKPSEIKEYIQLHYSQELMENDPFGGGGIDLSLSDDEAADEEEFKVTDMSGNTLVKHVGQLPGPADNPLPTPAKTSAHDWVAPVAKQGAQAAGQISIEERLSRIAANQEKGARIIKGLVKLFVEKGFFSAEEFAQRRKS